MSTSGGGCGSLDKATKAYMFDYRTATLDQAAPVQNTWYDLLPVTANVCVWLMAVNVEDANETLEVQVLIDGETIEGVGLAAAHSTNIQAYLNVNAITMTENITLFTGTSDYRFSRGMMFMGKSVQVQVRKTTAAGAGNLTGIVLYGTLASA